MIPTVFQTDEIGSAFFLSILKMVRTSLITLILVKYPEWLGHKKLMSVIENVITVIIMIIIQQLSR